MDARPFVTAALKGLFDQSPSSFHAASLNLEPLFGNKWVPFLCDYSTIQTLQYTTSCSQVQQTVSIAWACTGAGFGFRLLSVLQNRKAIALRPSRYCPAMYNTERLSLVQGL